MNEYKGGRTDREGEGEEERQAYFGSKASSARPASMPQAERATMMPPDAMLAARK